MAEGGTVKVERSRARGRVASNTLISRPESYNRRAELRAFVAQKFLKVFRAVVFVPCAHQIRPNTRLQNGRSIFRHR
jgi:hypothetical protein